MMLELIKSLLPPRWRYRLSVWRRRRRSAWLLRTPFFRRYPPRTDAALVDSRARVSEEHGYIYFRIPKSANSTVSASLMQAESGATADRSSVEGFKKGGKRLSEFSEADVEQLGARFYLFTVVRNPYARLLSAYLDKVERPGSQRLQVARYLNKADDAPISLDEFLDYLESPGALDDNAHWARQTDLVAVPLASLDYVGKAEQLETALRSIIGAVFGRSEQMVTFDPHRTGAADRLNALSVEQRDRIYAIYREDFEQLGYNRL